MSVRIEIVCLNRTKCDFLDTIHSGLARAVYPLRIPKTLRARAADCTTELLIG